MARSGNGDSDAPNGRRRSRRSPATSASGSGSPAGSAGAATTSWAGEKAANGAESGATDWASIGVEPAGADAEGGVGPEDVAAAREQTAGSEVIAAALLSVGKTRGALPRTTGIAEAAAAAKVGRGTALRTRILPRSVLGIACLILALAVGAGFSGVVLFSYYQYKLNQTNARVNTLVNGYKKQFVNAEGNLAAAVAAAKANIQTQLKAVQDLQAGPAALAALIKQVAPSVYFVHTLDPNGQPSVGTAFVVSSSTTQSLLLTSYTTVKAATAAPGPTVFIRQANTDTPVTVRAWDAGYDLALLVLPEGGLHPLPAAMPTPAPQPGDRIYAVSGLGAAGASIAQGTLIDVSASGVTEDAAIGPSFQGGPLINQAGQVVAVASRTYSPLNFTTDGVWFAPYVEAACNKVLVCPGGTLVGSH